MASWRTTVDGLVLPRQVAGHPALELVNTRAGWGEPYDERQEYLVSYEHLLTVARTSGALDEVRAERLRRRALRERTEAEAEVGRARDVRRDLHDVLLQRASRAATGRLAAAVQDARSRQRLVLGADEARWELPTPSALRDPLDALLVSAGDLLVERTRVGACPGHGCGWLFLDASGRRRWCQMAVCGNRAKQASHAARTRG